MDASHLCHSLEVGFAPHFPEEEAWERARGLRRVTAQDRSRRAGWGPDPRSCPLLTAASSGELSGAPTRLLGTPPPTPTPDTPETAQAGTALLLSRPTRPCGRDP